jgi:hypothetical protein
MLAQSDVPQITGIAWFDAVLALIIMAVSAGALRMLWSWFQSTVVYTKAKAKHEWLQNFEPLVAAAVTETELWANSQYGKVEPALKMEKAIELLKEKGAAFGVPTEMLSEPILKGFIESKLATGSIFDSVVKPK